jgi:hypothetical protein
MAVRAMTTLRSPNWLVRQLYVIASGNGVSVAAGMTIDDAASWVRMGDGMRALKTLLATHGQPACDKAAEEVAKWLIGRATSLVALEEIRGVVGQRATDGGVGWALQQRAEELRKQAA